MSDDTDIILPSDERAATYRTDIEGWVSRSGRYYGGEERLARWDGSTHIACADCGAQTEKGYTVCPACRDKRDEQRYLLMPQVEWDGKAWLYSEMDDEYFSDMESAAEHADVAGTSMEYLRLVICEPNHVSPLDADYCTDELPEDGDLPAEVEAAMEAFNAAVKGIVLSWAPGKTRPTIHPDSHGHWDRAQISDLLRERDALRAELIFCKNTIEWMQRGTTHWDKCEEAHPLCAMALSIDAALAAKEKP